MSRVRLRRPGPLEDRAQPQHPEQAAHPFPRDRVALPAEPALHLPRAVERRLQKLRVNRPHQAQIQRTLARAPVVERRAGNGHEATLPHETEPCGGGINHPDSSAVAQRPKAVDKRSRSMTSSPIFARSC